MSVINEAWSLCFVASSPSGVWPLSLSVTAVIVMWSDVTADLVLVLAKEAWPRYMS